jgi:hypothetical protein
MSDLSERHDRDEARQVRGAMGDAGGPHRAGPWFLLLALLGGLVCAAIFGPFMPKLFGSAGDIVVGATIIAVSIVLTGVAVAVATSLVLRTQSVAATSAHAREAKRHIREGLGDAAAITALRATMSVRSRI